MGAYRFVNWAFEILWCEYLWVATSPCGGFGGPPPKKNWRALGAILGLLRVSSVEGLMLLFILSMSLALTMFMPFPSDPSLTKTKYQLISMWRGFPNLGSTDVTQRSHLTSLHWGDTTVTCHKPNLHPKLSAPTPNSGALNFGWRLGLWQVTVGDTYGVHRPSLSHYSGLKLSVVACT